ncbi:MAG: UTP--glucose-1-phosphate uridylyltransferase [Candidatus Babeliales bacterium]
MDIIKAIIPAAGLGTRFLPYTKAVPKEMIPLLNKPAIQYIVEEIIAAQLSQCIMITAKNKNILGDYFDADPELEAMLKERSKLELIANLERINRECTFSFVRQAEPRGLGHAVWTARHLIGKEYFSVLLPDDIIINKTTALEQLLKIARQERASVIAVQEVPLEETQLYGIIEIKKQLSPTLFQVSSVTEKPHPKDAPSCLAVVGRYVLSHKIFQALEDIEEDANQELQLTDAITQMMYHNEKVFAYKIQGMRYDIGTPLGWIKAIIGCALQDPRFSNSIREYLQDAEHIDQLVHTPARITESLY